MDPPQSDLAPAERPRPRLTRLDEISFPSAVLDLDRQPDTETDILFAACMDGGVYRVDTLPSTSTSTSTSESEPGSRSGFASDPTPIGRHDSFASGVRALPGSSQIISAGYDGTLRWHDWLEANNVRTVQAHRFWSWKSAVSRDGLAVASVTGQYLCGGYKYEPAPEQEPSVRVFDAVTGQPRHSFSMTPPVLSVAFHPQSTHLAAANMMGDIKVWDLATGQTAAEWNTPDFTSWGIIKSHHYIGGIFDLTFTPDGRELIVCGMGPMRDPMAGNGKQTWQRFAWNESPVLKSGEIRDADRGNGLMESITFHPRGDHFVMAGRLAQGKWNLACFNRATSELECSLDTKMRVTRAVFNPSGNRLYLAGAVSQGKPKDGAWPEFGRVQIYSMEIEPKNREG